MAPEDIQVLVLGTCEYYHKWQSDLVDVLSTSLNGFETHLKPLRGFKNREITLNI